MGKTKPISQKDMNRYRRELVKIAVAYLEKKPMDKIKINITASSHIALETKKAISENLMEFIRYYYGQPKYLGFFVGTVMKATKNEYDPITVVEEVTKSLEKHKENYQWW